MSFLLYILSILIFYIVYEFITNYISLFNIFFSEFNYIYGININTNSFKKNHFLIIIIFNLKTSMSN